MAHFENKYEGWERESLVRISHAKGLSENELKAIKSLIHKKERSGPNDINLPYHPETVGVMRQPRLPAGYSTVAADGRRKVSYSSFQEHPLFVGRADPLNVIQFPSFGDCYLMSVLGSLAYSRPEALPALIHEHKGKRKLLSMTFWDSPKFGQFKSHQVVFDRFFPAVVGKDGSKQTDSIIAGRSDRRDKEGRREIWVSAMEKGYAVNAETYGAIVEGGFTQTVAMRLFGPRVTTETRAYTSFADFKEAEAKRWPVTACTTETLKLNVPAANWIRAPHAYSVLGAFVENGLEMVRLRDPHGEMLSTKNLPTGVRSEGNGCFVLSLSQASFYFQFDVHKIQGP